MTLFWFLLGYIFGGIINAFLIFYKILSINNSQDFIDLYIYYWERFHRP